MCIDTTTFFIGLSAISTLIIAIFTLTNYLLSKKMVEDSIAEKQKYKELLHYVIASQISAPQYPSNSVDTNFTRFKEALDKIYSFKPPRSSPE